jgi:hypothetical protein
MISPVLHAGCFYLELIADAGRINSRPAGAATLLGKVTITHDDSELMRLVSRRSVG